MGSQSWFTVMSINLSAVQSKQSGAAQRDTSVVQHQLLWCSRAVSTGRDCCVTTSAILETLHFQLMLISRAKGPSEPEQKRSWWDAARMQFQESHLFFFFLMTCLFLLFVTISARFCHFQLCNSVQIDEVITWAVFFCGFGFGNVTHGRLMSTMKQAVVIKSLFFFLIIVSSDRCRL